MNSTQLETVVGTALTVAGGAVALILGALFVVAVAAAHLHHRRNQ